jgi:ribosomal protein S24E
MENSQSSQNKMESKIIKQEKNPFLEREEYTLEITNEVTPTFDEVKTEIGKDAELTVVKKVNTNFGRQTFLAEAVVYDNVEAKEKIETIPQKVRKKMEEEKKKAEEEAAKKAEEEKKAAEEAKAAEAAATEETKTEEAPAEEAEVKEE